MFSNKILEVKKQKMKKFEAAKTAEKKIEKILADKTTETADLLEQITAQEKAASSAAEAMEKATAQGDVNAYMAAKEEYTAANEIKEMHETRLNHLNAKSLINRQEYEKVVADIYSEWEIENEKTKEKIIAYAEEMYAAAGELRGATKHANEILQRLQHEIYRDMDRTKTRNGKIIYLSGQNKMIPDFDVCNWGELAAKNYMYEKCTGEKIK